MSYVRARESKCFRSLGERARASSCVQAHLYFPAFTGQPPCHNEPARVKPGPCQRVSALHRVLLRSRIIPGSSEEHSAESRTGDRASCRGICVTVYHLPCQAAVFLHNLLCLAFCLLPCRASYYTALSHEKQHHLGDRFLCQKRRATNARGGQYGKAAAVRLCTASPPRVGLVRSTMCSCLATVPTVSKRTMRIVQRMRLSESGNRMSCAPGHSSCYARAHARAV